MNQKNNPRRQFLKTASLSGAIALSIPEIVSAALKRPDDPARPKGKTLKEGAVILFQGDSITDAGRDRQSSNPNDNDTLGHGYAFLTAGGLLYQYPEKQLSIYNKGISGNKVYQLSDRWEEDCLALKPDVLSILIGVNDYWHKHNGNYDGTIEVYRNDYRALLERTLKKFPDLQLVIGEPFAVNHVKAVDDSWYPAFDEYRYAAREIADEFNAIFIPYQKVFDQAEKKAPGSYWTPDGVHPSLAGAQLMAEAWLSATDFRL